MSADDTIEEREWARMQDYIRELAAREEEIRWELATREHLRAETRRSRSRRDERWQPPPRPRLRALRRLLSWLLGGEL
ncbi:MAG: hypothetical protein QXP81_10590 [Nitrososphaerota archaeon]